MITQPTMIRKIKICKKRLNVMMLRKIARNINEKYHTKEITKIPPAPKKNINKKIRMEIFQIIGLYIYIYIYIYIRAIQNIMIRT